VNVGEAAEVLVVFANCGDQPWIAVEASAPQGVKVGAESPRDNVTWGTNRWRLPADVPVGSEVTVPFTVRAPAVPGNHLFSVSVVQEGVAWLEEASPPQTVRVAHPGGDPELCPGVWADCTGAVPAASALQQCIDQTPEGGVLAVPVGTYLIDVQVALGHAMTLKSAGVSADAPPCTLGSDCAAFLAAPSLYAAGGILRVTAGHGVVLDHVVVDGNRAARLASSAASACAGGQNALGFNLQSNDCQACTMRGSASLRALCGSGFVWVGDDATITDNLFAYNGDQFNHMMWADGLTLLRSQRAVVTGNRFVDNSDVDLIFGGGREATVAGNTVVHMSHPSFAGLMLDNFNDTTPGDFGGTLVTGNHVDCGAWQCDFGIELGPHAWYPSSNTLGGTVTGNTVVNAKQGINVAGAGTPEAPLVLYENAVSGSPSQAVFLCGVRETSNLNITPASVVDRRGDSSPATSRVWDGCP
jgi:hypothetical protein